MLTMLKTSAKLFFVTILLLTITLNDNQEFSVHLCHINSLRDFLKQSYQHIIKVVISKNLLDVNFQVFIFTLLIKILHHHIKKIPHYM